MDPHSTSNFKTTYFLLFLVPKLLTALLLIHIFGCVLRCNSIQYFFVNTQGWFKTQPPAQVEVLNNFFNKIYNDAHTFVQTKLPTTMHLLEALYIRQCIDLLDGLLGTNKDTASTYFLSIYYITHIRVRTIFEFNQKFKSNNQLIIKNDTFLWDR